MADFWRKALPYFVIFALPFLFFSSAGIGRTVIVAGDFTGSDLLDMHYPAKVVLHEAIKNLTFPLWTPYHSNGFPFFAEAQAGVLYPLNLLFSPLPPYLALNYSVIFTFIVGGLGMYLFARLIFPDDEFSPLFAAVVFVFAGFFVTRLKHLNLTNVASLFPFALYFLKKFFQTKKFRFAIGSGIILGLMFLAGHHNMTFYCLFVYFIFFGFEFFLAAKQENLSSFLSPAIIAFFLITLTLFGVSAIQLLPSLELLGLTERLSFTLKMATDFPFHPKNLLTLISPYYFGNPALGTYKQNVRTMGVFWENSSYLGLLPLVLAFFSIFKIWRTPNKKKNLNFVFFSFIALFSLFLMLGRYTPIFGLLWTYVPGFSIFRFPTRFNLFFIFSLSLLSAYGAGFLVKWLLGLKTIPRKDTLESKEELALFWPLGKMQTQVLILAFVVADLFVFGQNFVGTIPAKDFLKKTQIIQFLENDKDLFRVYSVSPYADSPYQALGWKRDVSPLLSIREALPPNDNLVFHLASFSNRDWMEAGLNFQRRNKLERYLLDEIGETNLSKILGILNVKYLLSFAPTGGLEMNKVNEIDLGKYYAGKLFVYENLQVLPRVYFVPEAKVIKDEQALFDNFVGNDFYPLKTVLLEKEPKKILPPFSGTFNKFKEENSLEIKKYSPHEVSIQVNLKNEGYLVLSDSFYPGWRAQIDQKPVEILPANYLFRAVEMPAGKHEVRFFYAPEIFKIGLFISVATWILLIFLGLFFFFKTRFFVAKGNQQAKSQ